MSLPHRGIINVQPDIKFDVPHADAVPERCGLGKLRQRSQAYGQSAGVPTPSCAVAETASPLRRQSADCGMGHFFLWGKVPVSVPINPQLHGH